ncbi:hypothetical protein PGT21_022600 [Puccinia graminis f. sp. tritici]|uniref:Uncharacterized protein n=1 Tax=Puccinia graminis f. sp. tritici TaxID=56615 RepID=A0A5B0PIM7_PUCGR|nr:hypothetical protein PGT21_022600 [Puccinia graminis f. sp. tritici]
MSRMTVFIELAFLTWIQVYFVSSSFNFNILSGVDKASEEPRQLGTIDEAGRAPSVQTPAEIFRKSSGLSGLPVLSEAISAGTLGSTDHISDASSDGFDSGRLGKIRKWLSIGPSSYQSEGHSESSNEPPSKKQHSNLDPTVASPATDSNTFWLPSGTRTSSILRKTLSHSQNSEASLSKICTNPISINPNQEVRGVFLGCIDPKFWAWAWVIWKHVGNLKSQELEENTGPFVSVLNDLFIEQKQSHQAKTNIKQQPFDTHSCQKENISVQNLTEQGRYKVSVTDEGRFVYQKILKAIDVSNSDGKRVSYRISQPKHKFDEDLILWKELIISEAAVNMLCFYYKNTNYEKWKFAFGTNDFYFTDKLANCGTWWGDRPFGELPIHVNLLPWKSPLQPGLSIFGLNNLKIPSFCFERYVKPVNSFGSSFKIEEGMILEVQNSYHFFLGDQDQKLWAWLSWMHVQERNTLPVSYKPNLKLIIFAKNLLEKEIMERLDKKARLPLLLKLQNITQEGLHDLFDLMWDMNEIILEYMGGNSSIETILNEQKSVQIFFEFLFCKQHRKKHPIEITGKSHNFDHAAQQQYLQSTIKTLFLLENNNYLYELESPHQNHDQKIYISDKDILKFQIVVKILGNYYKSQNNQKWHTIFQEDQKFFNFLMRLSFSYYFRGNHDFYQQRNLPPIYSSDLLPWKKKYQNSNLSVSHAQFENPLENWEIKTIKESLKEFNGDIHTS